MLRNIPPSAQLLFLGLIILLRLPTFFDGFYLGDESLYLACAEKIQGGHLYIDSWFEGPPLMVWIYSFFVSIFGNGALTAIRIISIIYLFISVLYFQGFVVDYRVLKRTQLAPGIFLILLTCIPWYSLQLSAPLLMLYPLLFSFHTIIRLSTSQTGNYRRLFLTGILLFAGILADYHVIGFLAGICLAYFSIRQAKIDEFFGIILGVGVGFLLFLLFLYFNGIGTEFWEIGLSAYFFNWFNGFPAFILSERNHALTSLLLNWGVIIIVALVGLIHFRLRILNYVIVLRRVEQAMFLWLLSGLFILLFSGLQLRFSDLLTLTPPLAFYAAKAWSFRMLPIVRTSLVVLIAIPIILLGLHFANSYTEKNINFISTAKVDEWLGIEVVLPIHEKALTQYFEGKTIEHGIWVLDNRPELYHYLGASPITRYQDFSLTLQKLPYFDQENSLAIEPDAEIFHQLQQQKPDYVIDVTGGFAQMRKRFPSLLGMYEVEAVAHYSVWKEREEN